MLHKDDFPGLQPGDIVEIYHPENELLNDKGEIKVPRLMLMISKASIYPDNELQKPLNRETVNLEKSVAETFQLPNYRLIIFRKSLLIAVLQGQSRQTVFFELALRDRNIQVRFCFEGGFEIPRCGKFCYCNLFS